MYGASQLHLSAQYRAETATIGASENENENESSKDIYFQVIKDKVQVLPLIQRLPFAT